MKTIFLIAILLVSFVSFSQNAKKSTLIFKEIQIIELQNNKLIIQQYLDEHKDTTKGLPIFAMGSDLVKKFINNHGQLAVLQAQQFKLAMARDSVKNSDRRFKKQYDNLLNEYRVAEEKDKKKIALDMYNITKAFSIENPAYKVAADAASAKQSFINQLTLQLMLQEYQQDEKLVPTNFITSIDLKRYNESFQIKQNIEALLILNIEYKKLLEKELLEKVN